MATRKRYTDADREKVLASMSQALGTSPDADLGDPRCTFRVID